MNTDDVTNTTGTSNSTATEFNSIDEIQSKNQNTNRIPKCGFCRAIAAAPTEDETGAGIVDFTIGDSTSGSKLDVEQNRPLMKCAGCLTAYYCSKEHQRLDWKRHKVLCKSIQAKLAAVAAAEAEAHLAHGAPVIPTPIRLVPRRRFGSNTQLFIDQREQQLHSVALANVNSSISVESSCRSSAAGSPPQGNMVEGGSGSASSSIHGSMADLIASMPYHTSQGGRYLITRTVGNPKRARFPLTVIRERRSSIGSGEAARLAAAAAAAAAGKPLPSGDRGESESEDEDMESTFITKEKFVGGGRKRTAAGLLSGRHHRSSTSKTSFERGHMRAERASRDVDSNSGSGQCSTGIRDHRANPVLNLFTDPRFQLDAMVPRHTAFVLRVRRLAICVAAALRDYGWCVVDNFLGESHAKAIVHEATSLYMTPGLFADGQLMRAAPPTAPQLQNAKDVRSDQIYWFDNRVDRGVHISFLVSMVDSIVSHLTEHIPPYRINGRSRAMVACYPGKGTKYVRHVDNPDRDGRCVTTIYYLNEHWKREQGGVLRLYPETVSGPVDVEPLFDRLLFFWSDRRNPHEVLPSYQNRFAITIWYFDAQERAEALAREQEQQKEEDAIHYAQQHRGITAGMDIDPRAVAMKLANAELRSRSAPRSASCAELNSTLMPQNRGSPTASATSSTAYQESYRSTATASISPNPMASEFAAATSLGSQQQLPRTVPASRSMEVAAAAAAIAAANAAAQYGFVLPQYMNNTASVTWTTSTPEPPTTSYSDYSLLLPSDMISKLLQLSAGSHSAPTPQPYEPDQPATCSDIRKSNVVSPASSVEVDAMSGDNI